MIYYKDEENLVRYVSSYDLEDKEENFDCFKAGNIYNLTLVRKEHFYKNPNAYNMITILGYHGIQLGILIEKYLENISNKYKIKIKDIQSYPQYDCLIFKAEEDIDSHIFLKGIIKDTNNLMDKILSKYVDKLEEFYSWVGPIHPWTGSVLIINETAYKLKNKTKQKEIINILKHVEESYDGTSEAKEKLKKDNEIRMLHISLKNKEEDILRNIYSLIINEYTMKMYLGYQFNIDEVLKIVEDLIMEVYILINKKKFKSRVYKLEDNKEDNEFKRDILESLSLNDNLYKEYNFLDDILNILIKNKETFISIQEAFSDDVNFINKISLDLNEFAKDTKEIIENSCIPLTINAILFKRGLAIWIYF